jgi:hypothetical protein
MTKRRFAPPWTIDEIKDVCFIIRDKTGSSLRMG